MPVKNTNFIPDIVNLSNAHRMKYRILTLLACVPLIGPIRAQTQVPAPDNRQIEAAIVDPASPDYYPTLMSRYRQGDPALTVREYRLLYYGYMHQPEYNPAFLSPDMDSIVRVMLREPHLGTEDYHRLIRYGTKLMETDPFNPRLLNILTYAYGRIGDTENEIRAAARFTGVLDAILSTGEGTREDSPWHILAFSHAEDVLDYLGQRYRKPMLVSRTTEYFPLEDRKAEIRGYYFDYSRIYSRRPEASPRERRWQINGIISDSAR
jgi:hypothetical protein